MSARNEELEDERARVATHSRTPSQTPTMTGPAQDSDGTNTPEENDINDLEKIKSTKSIAETLPLPKEILFVSVVCLAQFTTQASLGQTLAILHVIGDDFGISNPADLSWLIAGYSLTVGTFILISGRFGDLFGYKRMLIIGFAWFALWSMVAGLAVYSNQVLFVFARVFQGIGPAITLPNALALLGATYAPGPRKNMVFSLFGATAPGGSVVGSTFASLFALTWWPWAFWSFGIAMAIIAGVAVYTVPDPPKKREVANKSLREKVVACDLPGALVGITSLVCINFAWNQAPIVGWSEPYVYVVMIIGLLLVPVFFFIEMRLAAEPLIPFHALSRDVGFVLACIACGWGSFGIWIFYTWQYLEEIRDLSPLLVSAQFSPVAVSGAIAAVCSGWLLGHVKPSVVMTMALTCFAIGNILMATAPPSQTYWAQTFVVMIITPWGMDMSFPAATIILSNSVERHHQGIAASLVNTVVNYSISLALGFAGTVEVHVNNGGKTKAETLHGYRGAYYMAIGLAVLGWFVSVVFVGMHWLDDRRKRGGREKS